MQLKRRPGTPCAVQDPDGVHPLSNRSFRDRLGGQLRHVWRSLVGRPADPHRFVDQLGHEVKTPLTSIRSFSEILRDNPNLPPKMREQYLRIILSESRRLESVVAVLLEGMSQPDAMTRSEALDALLERMACAAQHAGRQG